MEKMVEKILLIGDSEAAVKVAELFSKSSIEFTREVKGLPVKYADFDLIIEFLEADQETKTNLLAQAAKGAKADAILATSGPYGVTEIAGATNRPQKVIGLRFTFNPSDDSKCLVQMVKGLDTATETVEACQSLLEKAGTTPIAVKDLPGLILDRTIASVINEAAEMYSTELASFEDIDRITKLCLNWPMGPFEFADYLGIDNVVATLEMVARDEPSYAPCRLLRQMVAAGKLGKKSGEGFYTYR